MRNKLKQDVSLISKVVDEIYNEFNGKFSKELINHCISHFFKWQREAFNELEYSKYLINYFGTFSVIESRYEKWESKNNLTNNKISNNE